MQPSRHEWHRALYAHWCDPAYSPQIARVYALLCALCSAHNVRGRTRSWQPKRSQSSLHANLHIWTPQRLSFFATLLGWVPGCHLVFVWQAFRLQAVLPLLLVQTTTRQQCPWSMWILDRMDPYPCRHAWTRILSGRLRFCNRTRPDAWQMPLRRQPRSPRNRRWVLVK